MDFNYQLLVKYLLESLSEEELEQVMEWRKLSEQNESLFALLVKLRISQKYLKYNTSDRVETALKSVDKRIRQSQYKRKLIRWGSFAAVILLFITFSITGFPEREPRYLTYTVSEGEDVKKIDLEDGTTIWLNHFTTLQIPDNFSTSRKVKVQGEAYFDVKKGSSTPFVVSTQQLDIQVLGTSFSVNTNHPENLIETLLVSGKISLLEKETQKELFQMSPGEKVSFFPERNELNIENIDIHVSTAWHLRQIIFENATLRDIVNKLSVIYDININIESKSLAERRYRCVINKEETLAEALEHLNYMTSFKYTIEENEVFIKE